MIRPLRRWGHIRENRFLRNLGWLGVSEVFVRGTRLVTAIVLARALDSSMFGLAALVLTVNELVRVFNRNGISAKIVQCEEHELDTITNTAYRLNLLFCFALFAIQSALAYPVARFYNSPELVPMLQLLAVVYLLMPFGLVQSALVQRDQRLKSMAMIDGGQVCVDNLITAGLAIGGLGAWAVVLPKLLTAPIWVFGYRCAQKWRPSGPFWRFDLWRDVIEFGRYFLSIEVLKTARLNLDNMIIGRLLGMEALGIYYFARNAGLGFSLALMNAISSALFPNLCEVKNQPSLLKSRFTRNLKHIAFIAAPLIVLQASLAFIYVPLVFGHQWDIAVPVLTIMCLSALPRPLADSASALALATGRLRTDFRWNLFFTVLFVVAVLVAAQVSLLAVALTILVLYTTTNPLYLGWVWRQTFTSRQKWRSQAKNRQESILNEPTLNTPEDARPLVSVVMPVYNVEATIRQALGSVLAQTYSNLEVLVVDDESPDQSIQIVNRCFDDKRIRVIRQQNRGLAGARNTGIRCANGRYIAFLDSDDFWRSTKIEEHMKVMLADPCCGVSFSASMFVDQQGKPLDRIQSPKKKANYNAGDIFCRNPIGNGSTPVIRKGVLEQIGFEVDDKTDQGIPYTQYFDERLRQSEDVDCWTRIALLTGTKFRYIDQPLTSYRLNNHGLSANVDQQFETWLALLDKLESTAPAFARRYGPIAKAFQYRYLARRSIFQGQGRIALRFLWCAFKTQPMALTSELRRTCETLAAGVVMACMPDKLQRRFVARFI